LAVGSNPNNDHPQKKQVTTLPSFSNVAPINAEKANSDVNSNAKSETSLACTSLPVSNISHDELLLVWNIYGEDVTEEPVEHSISVDQVVSPQGLTLMGFCDIPKIKLANKGEWGQRYYSLRLRRGKKEKAILNFVWWEDSSDANLMNFNEMSKCT
jgi:hypothetical protein